MGDAAMQVKTNAANNVCGHTFYVMDASGAAPERAAVKRACQQVTFQLLQPFVLPLFTFSNSTSLLFMVVFRCSCFQHDLRFCWGVI